MKRFLSVLQIIVQIVLFVGLSVLSCYLLYQQTGKIWQPLVMAAVIIVTIPLVDLLHELGHVLFGKLSGIHVVIKSVPIFGMSARSELHPKHSDKIKLRFVVTTLGGLLVDLLLILLSQLGMISAWFFVLMPYATVQLITNLLPTENKYGKTDGLLIQEVLENRDTAKVLLVILKAQAMLQESVKMEELPNELLFQLPQLPEDDLNFLFLTQLRYEYCLAKGELKEAEKYGNRLKDLEEYFPEYMRK